MRKAFKYVSDQGRRQTSGRGLEGSMRRYFAQEDDAESFSVPFKYNLLYQGKILLKKL